MPLRGQDAIPATEPATTSEESTDSLRSEPPDSLRAAPPDSASMDRSIFRHLRGRVPPEVLYGPGSVDSSDSLSNDPTRSSPADAISADSLAQRPVIVPRDLPEDEAREIRDGKAKQGKGRAESSSSADPLLRSSGGDSLGSARDSLEAQQRLFEDRFGAADARVGLFFRIGRETIDKTPDRTTTEILPWLVPLTSIPSGSPFEPDPLDPGDLPGREPPLVLLEGLPISPPGWPESSPLVVDPIWLHEIRLSRPDVTRLPNDPNGGLALELELVRPDSLTLISGARLSDGSTDSNTDALYFVRPSASSMTHVLWADHKSAGRLEYLDETGQNVLVRHERILPWGTASLSYHHGFARTRVFLAGDIFRPDAGWLWDRSGLSASWSAEAGAWEYSLRGERTWHRLGWEGSDHPATRKSAVSRVLLKTTGPGTSLRPIATVQLDSERLRYYAPGRHSYDDSRTGLGFAGGVEGASKGWRYAAAAGRVEPLPGRSGLSATLNTERLLGSSFAMQMTGSRRVRPRLLPRSGNDLEISVGQALAFPEFDPRPKLETLTEGGLRVVRRGGEREDWRSLGRVDTDGGLSAGTEAQAPHEALELRWLRIDHAVLPDGGASAFDPSGFLRQDLLPHELDQELRVISLRGDWVRPLRFGFVFDGWFALRTADPGWKEQLWMTPAEARGRIAWSRRWFGDLDLTFFARGEWSASRAGRGGTIAPMNRFDGGAQATVGPWSAYLAWINLENDIRESATWTTSAMPLPLRSFRMGLVWRFLD